MVVGIEVLDLWLKTDNYGIAGHWLEYGYIVAYRTILGCSTFEYDTHCSCDKRWYCTYEQVALLFIIHSLSSSPFLSKDVSSSTGLELAVFRTGSGSSIFG
jgi:hypothetical protein